MDLNAVRTVLQRNATKRAGTHHTPKGYDSLSDSVALMICDALQSFSPCILAMANSPKSRLPQFWSKFLSLPPTALSPSPSSHTTEVDFFCRNEDGLRPLMGMLVSQDQPQMKAKSGKGERRRREQVLTAVEQKTGCKSPRKLVQIKRLMRSWPPV